MGMVISPHALAVAGGGGGLTIRGSNSQWFSGSSVVIPFPSGSAAGDTCIVFAGHGWDVTNPSGWTVLDNSTGSNFNGATFIKTLSSGDISTGSVTVSFANGYFGVVGSVAIVGSATVRAQTDARSGSGATSRTITTDGTPVSGDLAIWWGSNRGTGAASCSDGSQIQSAIDVDASCSINSQVLGASGAATGHFSFTVTTNGDYESGVILH